MEDVPPPLPEVENAPETEEKEDLQKEPEQEQGEEKDSPNPTKKRKSRFDKAPPGVDAKKIPPPMKKVADPDYATMEEAIKNAQILTRNASTGSASYETKIDIPESLLNDKNINFVGLVIGPGGQTQKQLQKDLGARVAILAPGGAKVSKETTEGLYFQISTTTQQKLNVAVAYINQLIKDPEQREALRIDQGYGVGGVHNVSNMPLGYINVEIVMIPSEKVGLLIGKRGETIQEAMCTSGAKIKVERDHNPEHPMTREVSISGSPEQIQRAKLIIQNYCNDHGVRPDGQMEYEETVNVPQNLIGLIIGKGGETIKNMMATTRCKVMIASQGDPTDHNSLKVVKIRGTVLELNAAKMQINSLIGQYKTPNGLQNRTLGTEEEIIAIPTSCVGTLLGRGGESVKRLAFLTVTRVQVLPAEQQAEDGFDSIKFKKVSIKGDSDCIEKAKSEIQNLINILASAPKTSQDIVNPYSATTPEEGYNLMQKYMKQTTATLPEWAVGSTTGNYKSMQNNYNPYGQSYGGGGGYNQNAYSAQSNPQYGYYQAPQMGQQYSMAPQMQQFSAPPGVAQAGYGGMQGMAGTQQAYGMNAAIPNQAPAPPSAPMPQNGIGQAQNAK